MWLAWRGGIEWALSGPRAAGEGQGLKAITDAGELRTAILEHYEDLSPRLQQIARFVLEDPHSMGVETLAVLSDRTGVPPSAIVRFAKTFGFEGAAPMQRLLKDGLLASQSSTSAYHERAKRFVGALGERPSSDYTVLTEFAGASSLSLDHISEMVSRESFEQAVEMIGAASVIHVAGFRRAFPVSVYLSYLLQQAGKRTLLVDGVGGLGRQQMAQAGAGELMIGVSFSPYAGETVELVEIAAEAGAEVLVITDSLVSAVAKRAACVLAIREAEVRGFRTLAVSMCVAQALAIAHTFRTSTPAG
jgi:DNA-binding MurR/RpiR family transcriptional regulator